MAPGSAVAAGGVGAAPSQPSVRAGAPELTLSAEPIPEMLRGGGGLVAHAARRRGLARLRHAAAQSPPRRDGDDADAARALAAAHGASPTPAAAPAEPSVFALGSLTVLGSPPRSEDRGAGGGAWGAQARARARARARAARPRSSPSTRAPTPARTPAPRTKPSAAAAHKLAESPRRRRGPGRRAAPPSANAARYARPATANAMPTGPLADPSSLAAADMLGIALAGRYADGLGSSTPSPTCPLRPPRRWPRRSASRPVRARRAPLAARAAARAAAAARGDGFRLGQHLAAPASASAAPPAAAAAPAPAAVARAAHGRGRATGRRGWAERGRGRRARDGGQRRCVARAAARPAPPTRGRETRRPDTALAHAPAQEQRGYSRLTARTMGRLNGGARANSRPLDVSLCGHQLTIGPAPASRAATATAARPPWPRQPSRQGQVRLLP